MSERVSYVASHNLAVSERVPKVVSECVALLLCCSSIKIVSTFR